MSAFQKGFTESLTDSVEKIMREKNKSYLDGLIQKHYELKEAQLELINSRLDKIEQFICLISGRDEDAIAKEREKKNDES